MFQRVYGIDVRNYVVMHPDDMNSSTMNVNELRKELGKRKLDVDGSRDVLVSRLDEAKRLKTD